MQQHNHHIKDLSKLCTMRVGGKAEVFIPNDITQLTEFVASTNVNYYPTGLGSNIIFTEHVKGVVIKTYKLTEISINNANIIAQAGVSLKKLASFAKKNNFSGAKWLESIPGSVGGALKMNAGCFGYEFWDYVQNVTILNKNGVIKTKAKNMFTASYREVKGVNASDIFLTCELNFNNIDITDEELNKRYDSQPIGTANCGSVFKNPKNYHAAKLIDNAGLKGYRIGGACVSTQHANFIINDGSASSEDIIKLMDHIQSIVKSKFDIILTPEVVII